MNETKCTECGGNMARRWPCPTCFACQEKAEINDFMHRASGEGTACGRGPRKTDDPDKVSCSFCRRAAA